MSLVYHVDCLMLWSFSPGGFSWWTILCITIGSIVGVSLGLLCCIYVATLHENDLWFSNIKVKSFLCSMFWNKVIQPSIWDSFSFQSLVKRQRSL